MKKTNITPIETVPGTLSFRTPDDAVEFITRETNLNDPAFLLEKMAEIGPEAFAEFIRPILKISGGYRTRNRKKKLCHTA